jgi:pimeloyl-ACP methyl ester carboxylesterase
MRAAFLDTAKLIGQSARVDTARAQSSRPGLSFVATSGGNVRRRTAPCEDAPRFLFATDGPNVIEHYDGLIAALAGKADVVVFEPPGTGGSAPASGFDFSIDAFTRVCAEVLGQVGPRTLVFPCYTGFFAQALARQRHPLVRRIVTPQTGSWADFAVWADLVDRRRMLRTPVLGQVLVAARKASIAKTWYRASTGDARFREPFHRAALESFSYGGCYCLASLMQGLENSPAPPREPLPVKAALPWGVRDRTHRGSRFESAQPGAEVVRFEHCGHSPELEDPGGFSTWLLTWETA